MGHRVLRKTEKASGFVCLSACLPAGNPAASATAEPVEVAECRQERTHGFLFLFLDLVEKTQGWYLGHVAFPFPCTIKSGLGRWSY